MLNESRAHIEHIEVLPYQDIFPAATVVPVLFVNQHLPLLKWEMSFWGLELRKKMEMSQTVASGMKRVDSKVSSIPFTI